MSDTNDQEQKDNAPIKIVRLRDIRLPGGYSLRQEKIDSMVESVRTLGVLNPLLVDEDMGLVSGFHRYHSALVVGGLDYELQVKTLNSKDEESKSKLNLAKLDENLIRFGYNSLDESIVIKERIELLRKLRPDLQGDSKEKVKNAAKYLASEMGVSERKIYLDLQIASLDAETVEIIKKTPIVNQKHQLARLSRIEDLTARIAAANEMIQEKNKKPSGEYGSALSDLFKLFSKIRKLPEKDKRKFRESLIKLNGMISQLIVLTAEQSDGNGEQDGKGG